MITEIILGIGVYGARQIGKSIKLDEQAMQKYSRAFSREEEARRIISQKETAADESLLKLARRKKAIVETSIKEFLNVYQSVQNISFIEGDGLKELKSLSLSNADISQLNSMSVSCSKPLSDKELVTGIMFKGITGMMVKDSERNLSAASNQMRAANAAYSQAETISVMFDAVINRADRMSDLLKRMNAVLHKSISETKRVIETRGSDARIFSNDDKLVVINCINWVKGVKEILDVPLFNKEGKLEKQAEEALRIGEEMLCEINMAI